MGEMTKWVFPRVLEEKAQINGDRTFLQYEDEPPVSYVEVDRKVNQVANGLAHLGVSKGDRVIILMDNSLEFIYTWFGVMKLGAVQINAFTYRPDFLRHLIDQADPKLLVLSDRVLERLLPIKDELSRVDKMVVWSREGRRVEGLGIEKKPFIFDDLYDFPETTPAVEIRHSDPERINFTYKSSGHFLGVPKTHAQNHMSVMNYVEMVEFTSDDVCFICQPLSQAYVQVFTVYPALLSNAKVVISRGFNRDLFWHQVKQTKATVINCLGVMLYFLWLKPFRDDDADNPVRAFVTNLWSQREYFLSWGTVTRDGEVLAPEGWKGFQCEFESRFNVKLLDGSGIEGFGPTEEQMPTSMFFWPM